jgi:hypothetical protein
MQILYVNIQTTIFNQNITFIKFIIEILKQLNEITASINEDPTLITQIISNMFGTHIANIIQNDIGKHIAEQMILEENSKEENDEEYVDDD